MNSVQIEENVKDLVQNISNQSLSRDEFVYELLLAYGHRKSVVSRVKSGERNLSKTDGEVILKRHLYFKPCQTNLFAEVDEIKRSKTVETNKIRFVVVTDFNQIIAVDTKTQDTLDIELNQLPKHFDFFLPWAGMEKMVYRGENPADVKAAEKMADFFDHIKEQNYPANATKEQLHELVVFLNRLLFCFFAEDTKIFGENQFTNLLNQHTSEDGSNVAATLERLFEVLNKPAHQRGDLPQYLASFPYVNGGLFKKDIVIPKFDAKARRMLLDSGQLDWADINPDIFGSMIQGVADPETRSKMGMHYTSVTNIMKVIEPLFLNDFYSEFEKCKDNINKLRKLQVRLSRIKVFDPACGSGNFLIIAYKEIRLLEIEILKRIRELEGESDSGALGLFDESHSSIRLEQFYGIELDDFAHEMAILSLWLVEHQMNMVFETEFGYTAPTLPLKQSGRIFSANALQVDWEQLVPTDKDDEIYLLGNPPYLGQRNHKEVHIHDMDTVFKGLKNYKNLDYVSCWFIKAAKYIKGRQSFAFVTTNSICQGSQVGMLWPPLFELGVSIQFAYEFFKWKNSARDNAGVMCTIIGLSKESNTDKKIYTEKVIKSAKYINPYIVDGGKTIVASKNKPISNLPFMIGGNQPREGGFLTLTNQEKEELVATYSNAEKYIRPLVGTNEMLKGISRWCIWIEDDQVEEASSIPPIQERIEKVRNKRLNGNTVEKNFINMPHRFVQVNTAKETQIVIPNVSTSRRKYVPIGLLPAENVITNLAMMIPDGDLTTFGLVNSHLHMIWMKAVAGRLGDGLRYTVGLCYNTFPVPPLSEDQKAIIEEKAIQILEARESHPHTTLEKLYDPEIMPEDLKQAHLELDQVIESLYSNGSELSEMALLEKLFQMYEDLVGDTVNA
ncbi:N-6 DNA methylase [Vibrio sp. Of7-15]|uniref:DNA methyltransferase n=1 Tax=Vibrio sp. Of7-15 TaxID=2724879 RepID=UPI001EF1CE75|nr:DNA methyltransferase [Vibrio sp. Of7-15]MCG7499895.1 N-6 DNA methylase [Vibrio sp. Of7-15]